MNNNDTLNKALKEADEARERVSRYSPQKRKELDNHARELMGCGCGCKNKNVKFLGRTRVVFAIKGVHQYTLFVKSQIWGLILCWVLKNSIKNADAILVDNYINNEYAK